MGRKGLFHYIILQVTFGLESIAYYNIDMSLLLHFVKWFVMDLPISYWRLLRNLGKYILEMFGVGVHWQMFIKPMFHDSTFVGYLLTVSFRLIFIVSGYLFVLITYLVGIILGLWIWLGFLLGGFNLGFSVIWLVMVGVMFGVRLQMGQAWSEMEGAYTWDKLKDVCDRDTRGLMVKYGNFGFWWKDVKVQWWLLRMGLWANDLPLETSVDRNVWGASVWKRAGVRGGDVHVGILLRSFIEFDEGMKALMRNRYIEMEDLDAVLDWYENEIRWWKKYLIWHKKYQIGEMAGFNRGMTSVKTSLLDRFSIDLTANANSLPEAIGRDEKYQELFAGLGRSRGENIMVIGESGVGKSTFIGGIAKMIMNGNAPEVIRNKRLVKIEIGRLLAGVKTQSESVSRLVHLLDEVKFSRDIILFIDDIHTLMTNEGLDSGMNLFSVLQEAIGRSDIALIGATTIKNFKRFIEPVESFAKMFNLLKIEEPDDGSAILILQNLVHDLEVTHGVVYSYKALRDAVVLSRRYLAEGLLPDKAKRILDEAGANAKMSGLIYVDEEMVAKLISVKSGVPVHKVDLSEKSKLLELEAEIHKAFVGQDSAVVSVADSLRRARLDVNSGERPIGSFMFVGPTGVGKTELSRQLAKVYFGSADAMIRLDMTEFSQLQMINRLIGSPVGVSGFGQGGELTEKVRRQPFCLILLDEIEKAHPKVWDLLLQVMEDGRLTDAAGLTVDFSHTILIATSNAVTSFIQEQIRMGRSVEEMKDELNGELAKTFRLEFINRFDGIVPFAPLDLEQLQQVVRLEMQKLADRLMKKEIKISWSDEVVLLIAQRTEKEQLGARPIRRYIQNVVESKIAKILLTREDTRGLEIMIDEKFVS